MTVNQVAEPNKKDGSMERELYALNTWWPTGGTVCGSYGNFGRWELDQGCLALVPATLSDNLSAER